MLMMRTLYLNFQIVGEFMVIQPGYISGFFFATKKGVFFFDFCFESPEKREFFNDKNKGFTSGTLKKIYVKVFNLISKSRLFYL